METKSDDIKREREGEIWGTWEELLLACAVNRYGRNNWESIAIEMQNKTSSPHFLLTPLHCKQRYHDLYDRFKQHNNNKLNNNNNKLESVVVEDEDDDDKIPWLEELRKLRVAELRREVQRYDDSIVTLQSQVKRLEDERDKQVGDSKPDLAKLPEISSSPADIAVNQPLTGDADDSNQSFNESNSTTDPNQDKIADPVEVMPDTVTAGESPVEKPVGSCDGSSDTILKNSVVLPKEKTSEPSQPSGPSPVSDSPEFESVAESKGGVGEEGAKENSDVQSSASLSMRNRRVSGNSSSGDEPENDDGSPAIKQIAVKSQPLIGILEIIKSREYGNIFERRLESQESAEYKNLIRQHIDLETIQTRLKEGQYSCNNNMSKFFRDLLLLFNNAIIFYPKKSSEYNVATKLRELVLDELPKRTQKSHKSSKEESESLPKPSPPLKKTPKSDPELSDTLLVNPKSTIPFIACRKRSSVSGKARTERKDPKKATTTTIMVTEEKPELKPPPPPDSDDNEPVIVTKRKRDRPVSGVRSSRTGNKNKNISSRTSNNNPGPSSSVPNKRGGDDDNPDPKEAKAEKEKEKEKEKDKKNNDLLATTSVAKRQSVANFLNKMKRSSSSSSNNGTLLETLKNSSSINRSNNKRSNGKGGSDGGDGKRDRQSTSHKQEQISPAKRSVGRPPKRAPPPPTLSSKRSRDAIETEAAASRQPRKRSRR
ncbi:hypothetical protein GIB67_040251 [Kingdonia uniflora]|uniref:Bromo domain-containing protein n=1 Tax=Kingdonia uniflora TaxID=39325 RepID=A0A7J7MV93_9MAGN|nr:hypothetical protein GIB67_040251 [Kingdonia uniflora]